jgi:hypothetical protein
MRVRAGPWPREAPGAINNARPRSSPPPPLLSSFAPTAFKPPPRPTLPAASTSHCGTTRFAARASVDCHRQQPRPPAHRRRRERTSVPCT